MAHNHALDTVKRIVVKNTDLVVQILTVTFQFRINNGLGAFVALNALAREHLHVNHRAAHACWHAQRRVFHVRGFFAENGAQQFFFRRELRFAFGRYFAHQHVARLYFRADINDAAFVQTVLHFFRQIRNIAGDFFCAQFGITRHNVQLFDMDRGVTVVCRHSFANQNRVFVVVAVPRHKCDGHVLTKRQFAQIGRGAVGNQITALQYIARTHGRTLVDVGGLVGTGEFHQIVNVHTAFFGRRFIVMHAHHHAVCVHIFHHAAAPRHNRCCAVHGYRAFNARSHQRFLSAQARHSLTLHVRTHQSTVRVIVFQERNQRSRHGYHLPRCHVHILHAVGRCQNGFAFFAASNQIAEQFTVFIQIGIRLRNHIAAFFNGRQIVNFIGYFAVHHAAIRCFQKAVFVGACVNRQRVNQTNVWTFWCFNWAHATVMRWVYVAHFKARAFACQTTRPQSRNTALVRDFRQRIGLIHKLRQLARTEKLFNRSGNRFCVNQIGWHQTFAFSLVQTLFNGTLHTRQTAAELVFHQFAHRTYTAVAQVVNIVHLAMPVTQLYQRGNRYHNVFHA